MHLRGGWLAEDLFQRGGADGGALVCALISGRDGRRGDCALSFSEPDWAELKAWARERSCLWLSRDGVWGNVFGVLRWVYRLWSGRFDGESHEGISVCEIEHV
jgi:hypothetical protein